MGWQLWVVVAAASLALQLVTIVLRRQLRDQLGYAGLMAANLAVLLFAHWTQRDASGLGQVATWLAGVMLIGPMLADRWERRALASDEQAAALRAARLHELLAPGRLATRRRRQLQNLVEARTGGAAPVLARLATEIAAATDTHEAATLHEEAATVRFLAQQFAEGVAEAERYLPPDWPARHPTFGAYLVRAYGELGRLDGARATLRHIESGVAARDPAALGLLTGARVTLLAYSGRVRDVDRLLTGEAGLLIAPRAKQVLHELVRRRAQAASLDAATSNGGSNGSNGGSNGSNGGSNRASGGANGVSATANGASGDSRVSNISSDASNISSNAANISPDPSKGGSRPANIVSSVSNARSNFSNGGSSSPASGSSGPASRSSAASSSSTTSASSSNGGSSSASAAANGASTAEDAAAVARFLDEVAVRAADSARHLTAARPTPRVTVALIALNVAAAVASSTRWSEPAASHLVRAGALFGPALAAGEWWRPFSAMFLHADLLHLLFNMLGLFMLGRFCEEVMGPLRFFVIYVAGGLAGAVGSTLARQPSLSVGASGAVMGLLGALIVVLVIRRGVWPEAWRRTLLWNLVLLGAVQIYIGFEVPVIDNGAHVGGMVGGAAAALLVAPGGLFGRSSWARAVLAVLALAGAVGIGWSGLKVTRTSLIDTLARMPQKTVTVGHETLRVPAYWELDAAHDVVQDPYLGAQYPPQEPMDDPEMRRVLDWIANRKRSP